MSFRKFLLFSVLTALLGFSLVYALSIEYTPGSTTKTGFSSPRPGTIISLATYLLVFAYDGDNVSSGSLGFVQASVAIDGTGYNGTTSADLQNPLIFTLSHTGVYSVSGVYNSSVLQNVSVQVTSLGGVFDAFLNFGSSPLPPLGHIWIEAWGTSQGPNYLTSGPVQASVSISGPEQHNGTTASAHALPPEGGLIFSVQPGNYTVSVTYGSETQNETLSVEAGQTLPCCFWFGDDGMRPP